MNHTAHTVEHRYREFESLHTRLSSILSIPHLPRKVVLHRRSAKLIEQRRQLLEIYLNEILRRCQQQTIMPEDLARFLQIPPYDTDLPSYRKEREQEQDINNEQMRYVLEHAPCISITDHCPWNNDQRSKFFFLSTSILYLLCLCRNIRGFSSLRFNAFNV